jgi:hypothetical protein
MRISHFEIRMARAIGESHGEAPCRIIPVFVTFSGSLSASTRIPGESRSLDVTAVLFFFSELQMPRANPAMLDCRGGRALVRSGCVDFKGRLGRARWPPG